MLRAPPPAYLINRRWTFQSDGSKRKFAAVVLLYGLTFVLQVGLFAVLFPWVLGLWGSQTIAQVVGFVIAQGVATHRELHRAAHPDLPLNRGDGSFRSE